MIPRAGLESKLDGSCQVVVFHRENVALLMSVTRERWAQFFLLFEVAELFKSPFFLCLLVAEMAFAALVQVIPVWF